jgi:hypothetical protein
MKVRIERCIGHLGVEMPLRFRFGRRDVEILDQWYGLDYCYFKIEGSNDNLYILRFDEGRAQWEPTISKAGGPTAAKAVPSEILRYRVARVSRSPNCCAEADTKTPPGWAPRAASSGDPRVLSGRRAPIGKRMGAPEVSRYSCRQLLAKAAVAVSRVSA